ncbi:MAG: ABC transporter substrate-binding protein [Sulfurimonas sp.]
MRIVFFIFFTFSALFATSHNSLAKDFIGKEFSSKNTHKRIIITCYGGAVQQMALFLDPKTIIAHPGTQRFPFFGKLYPALTEVPSIGTFNDINFETLLKLKPDVVFAGVISSPTNQRIEQFGIPVFTLGIGKHNITTLLQEFKEVGIFIDQQTKANKLIDYWQEQLAFIQTHIPPKKARLKVLYVNGSNKFSSEGKHWWGDDFITQAGGINIVQNIQGRANLTPEKLIAFNPDVIILSKNRSSSLPPQELKQNSVYKNLKAVKNDQLYISPVGGFWWDRPSPEAILGIMWLSKILYPKEMKELDLKQQTKYFFKTFYNYNLSDQEYKSFFQREKDIK